MNGTLEKQFYDLLYLKKLAFIPEFLIKVWMENNVLQELRMYILKLLFLNFHYFKYCFASKLKIIKSLIYIHDKTHF